MRVSARTLFPVLCFVASLFPAVYLHAQCGSQPAPTIKITGVTPDPLDDTVVIATVEFKDAQLVAMQWDYGWNHCDTWPSCDPAVASPAQVRLRTTCKTPGSQTFSVGASNCLGTSGVKSASDAVSIPIPEHTAEVSQSIAAGGQDFYATIHYKFTNASSGVIALDWMPPTPFAPGPRYQGSFNTPDAEGTVVRNIGRVSDAWRLLRVRGTACGDRTATDIDEAVSPVSCPIDKRGNDVPSTAESTGGDGLAPENSCSTDSSSCFSDPIHAVNGAMRFVENDPIPGGLTRIYDSNKRDYGQSFFGKDWTTFLEANFFWFDGADNRDTLVFELGDRLTRIFERRNGTYVRIWPESAGPIESIVLDGTTGETVYRDLSAGKEWRFRATDGWLMSFSDMVTGRATVITRNSGGIPSRIADSWGNWAWIVTSDSRNLITRLELESDPTVAWTFNYGADYATYLYSIQGPGNVLWRTYTYDIMNGGRNLLVEVRDGSGNIVEGHDYDVVTQRTLTSQGPSGDVTAVQYGLAGRIPGETVTETIYANGRVERRYLRVVSDVQQTVQIDGGCSSCGGGDLTLAFDAVGRIWRRQDARGWITEYDYGTRSDVSPVAIRKHLRPSGCSPADDPSHCRLDPDQLAAGSLTAEPESRTVSYTYGDASWPDRVTTVTEASVLVEGESKSESVTYAPGMGQLLTRSATGWTEEPAVEKVRHTTSVYYNGTEAAAFDPSGPYSAWKTKLQPRGLRKSVDGPRTDVSDVTLYVYYPVDAAVSPSTLRGRLWAVKNAAGQVTRYDSYDAFGNPLTVVDANGVATASTFNSVGRLLTSTLKGVAGCSTSADPICRNDLTTTRSYASTIGPLMSETRPGGGVTAYSYDGRGRIATVSRGPALNDLRERIEYIYDAVTSKKSVERTLAYEGASWVEKKRESFTYDTFERLKRTVHPDSTFVEYDYDAAGNLATVRDENHAQPNTRYDYDATSRLTEVRQTLGGSEAVTSYDYDGEGNLTSVSDPNGNATTYLYDDFGQMLRQTSPVTGDTTYEFDDAGNLLRTVDARGAVTTRSYDILGRVTQSLTTGEGASETITWGYDSGTFGVGRMTSMTDGIGTTSYTYNRLGLLLTETRPIEGTSYVTKYGYDANGNRAKFTYPSARVVDTTFDYAGRPLTAIGKVGNKATSYVTATTYLPFGPMLSMTYGNGLVKSMTYDTRYRLDRLTFGTIADYDYGYDNAGNITTMADLTNAAYNRGYLYDDLNRLISASGPWGGGSYGYDAMGSMTNYQIGARNGTFSYAGMTPKLTSVFEGTSTIPVQYDSVGNELTGTRANGAGVPSEQRWYTPRNSLHLDYLSAAGTKSRPCIVGQVCPNAPTADKYYEFGYDGRGVRMLERLHTGSTLTTKHYAYSPELSFLGHKAPGTKGTGIEAIWYAGAPIAQEVWGTHGQTKWTFTDHLGTPLLQTNSSKAVVWRAEYEPYGNVYAMRTGTKDDQPLRFPGQERLFDGSTGTEERYNIFRWYRSGWGKYTQVDPMVQITRVHYAYGKGSPLRFRDRLGWKPLDFSLPPALPSRIPPLPRRAPKGCCSTDAMERALDDVNYFLDNMMRMLPPTKAAPDGYVVAMTWKVSRGPDNEGNDVYLPQGPDSFDPHFANRPDDKCVEFCTNYHEWAHHVDDRSFNSNWSTDQMEIFDEWPGYLAEKACLKTMIDMKGE